MSYRVDRDRDVNGRPLSSRPRDELGRPLARDAVGVDPLPEVIDLQPEEALDLAQDLLRHGRPFQAHEVLEFAWKSAPATERSLWQGLAQIAVAITHAKRGNTAGAEAVLRRARSNIAPHSADSPYSIDVPNLVGWCDTALTELPNSTAGLGTPQLKLVKATACACPANRCSCPVSSPPAGVRSRTGSP